MPVSLRRDGVLALLLAKQHLAAESAGGDIAAVADDLLGLHATDRGSPYLQLQARIRGFRAEHLDTVLDGGRAARIPGMRRTLFIESAELIPLVVAATRRMLRAGHERYLAGNGLTRPRYEGIAARIEEALAGRALDARGLREAVAARAQLTPVLVVMCDEGRLVRWRGRRGWRASPPTYRRFADALPDVRLDAWDEDEAMPELLGRYVRRYGPVTEKDIAWWSGFRRADVRAALGPFVTATLDGAEVLIDETDLPAARSRPRGLGQEVSLLPLLDPYLQNVKDRRRFVDAERLPFVVDPAGNATSTILVGGRAAGVWDLDGEEVRLLFFDSPGPALRRRVRAAAAELGSVVEVDRMLPLSAAGTGGAAHPLRVRR